jgi:RNA polymerase sigma factor for flagellar operon FliA
MSYDKHSLILNHMKLANDIATREWRTATHALKHDDMVSLAYFGLVDAADRWEDYCKKNKYDPAATQYFKVFASFRVRGAIRDFIRKEDWATRTLRSKAKALKEAGQDDGLSVEQLAEKTGMSVAEINKVLAKLATKPVSLDAYTNNSDWYAEKSPSHTRAELKDDIDTEGSAFANEVNEVFLESFKTLPDPVQIVLALHYYKKMDLRTIADTLKLTESKVSQMHSTGILYVRECILKATAESGINV